MSNLLSSGLRGPIVLQTSRLVKQKDAESIALRAWGFFRSGLTTSASL